MPFSKHYLYPALLGKKTVYKAINKESIAC